MAIDTYRSGYYNKKYPFTLSCLIHGDVRILLNQYQALFNSILYCQMPFLSYPIGSCGQIIYTCSFRMICRCRRC